MPMGTNFNLDMRNIRLPEMPGVGIQPGNMGVQPSFRQSSVGVELPPLQTNALPDTTQSTMPFFPQEQQSKRLDLKTSKDGKVDWLATLISAGALAAGALTGNTRLAAAGSGFLKGQQQRREKGAAYQEKQLVRDEAQAERDFSRQEKADAKKQRDILTVEDSISREDYKVARSALSRIADPDERARLNSLIDASEKEQATEDAKKDEKIYRQNYLFAMDSKNSNTMRATAGTLRQIGKSEWATMLENAAQKQEEETGRIEKDRLTASYDNDILIRKEVSDLITLRQQLVSETRISPSDKATRLSNLDSKIVSAQKDADLKQIDLLMALPGFTTNQKWQKEASTLATRAFGFDVTPKDLSAVNRLSPNQMYNKKVDQLVTEMADPKLVHEAATNLVRLVTKNPQWEYDPTKTETSLEDMPAPYRTGIERYSQAQAKDILSGKVSIPDFVKTITDSTGTEIIPTSSTADSLRWKTAEEMEKELFK